METPWTKATGAATVGMFLLNVVTVGFVIWDRARPQGGPSAAPQGVAIVAGSWFVPVLLGVCLLASAGLYVFAAHISRGKKEKPSSEYKWLHDIAERQAADMRGWVEVDCSIGQHQLLGDDPYIDLTMKLISFSVYSLTLVKVSGFLWLGGHRFREPLEISMNNVKNLPLGEHGFFNITQPLRRADAVTLLNTAKPKNGFALYDLTVDLQADPGALATTLGLNCSPPVIDDEFIAKYYPKLEIKVKALTCRFIVDLRRNEGTQDGIVTMEVGLTNHRDVPVLPESFHLEVTVKDQDYTALAETGDIWEKKHFDTNGELLTTGKHLSNLLDKPSLRLTRAETSGSLQFILKGAGTMFSTIPYQLVVVDTYGEKHLFKGIMNKPVEN